MTTMEHLKTEIYWMTPPEEFSVHEQKAEDLEGWPGVFLGAVNMMENKMWFITSYDAEVTSQKQVQDRILSIFTTDDVFVVFNGYEYAPKN